MKKRVSCVRTCLVKEGSVLYESESGERTITSPREAADFAASFFNGADKETIYICCLDAKCQPVCMEMTAKGGSSWCNAEPAQVFKTAILSNASGIICFHNHPSGKCTPSKEDRSLTRRLKEAGEILGIKLWDHIILGDNRVFYSFKEAEIL